MEKLFSYGTLQQKDVQLSTFGRLLNGTQDALIGYVVSKVKITDQKVIDASGTDIHPILKFTGNESDVVNGTVFEITKSEMAQADEYEVDDYIRVATTLNSGNNAWIYAAAKRSA
ncbi:MAG: gamma-glutamylcyclotransferase family protein [Nitrosomonadaceae bacterium]